MDDDHASIRRIRDDEREAAIDLLGELWTDAEPREIRSWTSVDSYRLFGRFVDADLVGVAGVTVMTELHHERMAWLYSLVVDPDRRGEGHGSALVAYVESWADERGFERLGLASPLDATDSQAFYDHLDFERWGYVVEKSL
ncbi:GNAT family N-acetyltransferase [Halococcoides cellulosivorans]|uniref:N-acetyltransferase n=1 Tax=Halococcoides cellulosivorans TaxID=1679096 RepID=A0A2R4X1J4_9EURY|nr:GNAT family N-acetyltransferase [Halococcoides cellulosivorans]AWB27660.1 N-acetyltransferase [Halococcoides cellulosivorans]